MEAGFNPEALRQRRKAKGVSQVDLSLLLGVTQQSVSQWETGYTAPEIHTLPALAAALGCRIDDLFTHPEQPRSDVPAAGAA